MAKSMSKRIVLIGGPGTGKSSVLNELGNRGYTCYEEVSREVTKAAQEQGIDQLFLTEPLTFSELLLDARINQFLEAEKESSEVVFIDRGIPDVLAYMDYVKSDYPDHFVSAAKNHRYDRVFSMEPWERIFVSDNERYENFEQAKEIHEYIVNTYKHFEYDITNIPIATVEERTDFIIDHLNN